jgi:hypothetical protein
VAFQNQPPFAVLLYGVGCRYQAKHSGFILPIINAQQSLEIRKGNKGMQRKGRCPGFVVHENKVSPATMILYKGFLLFL